MDEKFRPTYLEALVNEFGEEEVANWDRVEQHPYTRDLFRLTVNGATFHGERLWWGDGPRDYTWTIYCGGHVDRYHELHGGERLRSIDDLEEVFDLVQELAPEMPPEEWGFEAWSRRGGDPIAAS